MAQKDAIDLKIEDFTNVSERFDVALKIIFTQAAIQFSVALANSLSHFVLPQILMYARHIKIVSTLNLIGVGCSCLVIFFVVRLNDAANLCSGNHEKENHQGSRIEPQSQFLVLRGQLLYKYVGIVVALTTLFIALVSALCVYNLKKMGF